MKRFGMDMARKVTSACAAAVLAVSLVPAPAFARADLGAASAEGALALSAEGLHYTAGSYVTGEILVEYDNASSSGLIRGMSLGTMSATLERETGIEVVKTVVPVGKETGALVKAATPEGMSIEEAVASARAVPGVANAQPNFRYELVDGWDSDDSEGYRELAGLEETDGGHAAQAVTGTNDKYLTRQYYLGSWEEEHGVSAIDAWEWARCEGEVTVAVVDTGCAVNHLDLADNIVTDFMWDAYSETRPGTIISGNVPLGDNSGHGTHVCGIAGAVADNGKGIAGASYNANILPIKVFDNSTSNPGAATEDIVKAYKYIKDLKDDDTIEGDAKAKIDNLHVINMSLGGYGDAEAEDDRILDEYVWDLRKNYEVLTVCAGGNGNRDGTPRTDSCYPSDFDSCFSVTATNADGANVKWSDYNKYKDISAPGYDIYSTYPGDTEDDVSYFTSLNGTSMASPLVAGCAALLWVACPGATPDEVVSAIRDTANKIDPGTENYNERVGNTGSPGVINAEEAVKAIMERTSGVQRVRMKSCNVDAIPDQVHTGRAVQPKLVVTYTNDAGETVELEQGKDYTLEYRNNRSVGKANVTVVGRGTYIGRVPANFYIKYDMGVVSVNPTKTTYDFTGAPVEPTVNVTHMSKALKEGEDYTVSYRDNDEPGEGVVVVTGKGDKYMNSAEATFSIVDKRPSLANATLSSIQAQKYTGWAIKPAMTVKLASKQLTEGVDYKIDYIDNANPGLAVVRVRGIGAYGGQKLATFRIDAACAPTAKTLVGKAKALKLTWSKGDSLVAGYQVMYSLNGKFSGAKTATVKGGSKTGATLKGLKAKKKYYAKVRSYTVVQGEKQYSPWSKTLSAKTK